MSNGTSVMKTLSSASTDFTVENMLCINARVVPQRRNGADKVAMRILDLEVVDRELALLVGESGYTDAHPRARPKLITDLGLACGFPTRTGNPQRMFRCGLQRIRAAMEHYQGGGCVDKELFDSLQAYLASPIVLCPD